MIKTVGIKVKCKGLHAITSEIESVVSKSAVNEGLCTLYIQHTSASLLIQEDYDSSAKADLENWLNRLVPENDSLYTHTLEGPDDMPAHIKAALTSVSLSIPIADGKLLLGTWQGIFLWEHRNAEQQRKIIVHIGE